MHSLRFLWFWAVTLIVAALTTSRCLALDVNLRGYGSPPAQPGNDVTQQLQAAIDAVGASGGGTVYVQGDTLPWSITSPVFISNGNVKIQGTEGRPIFQGDMASGGMPGFILGLPKNPRNTLGRGLTAEHYPLVAMDGSAGNRYGLRTKDSQNTTAFGYFSASPFALGAHSCQDFHAGVETRTYWGPPYGVKNGRVYDNYADYQYTLELAVKNNAAGTLQGTLCGIGAPTTANDMTDRSMIWALTTDPAAGNNLVFKFRLLDGTVQSVSFNTPITDQAIHRLTVQFDLTHVTGSGDQCTVWLDGILKNKLVLSAGTRLNEYAYGAFRLGDVTASPLSGNAGGVDWTFCGLKLSKLRRYDDSLNIGSAQARLDAGTIDDNYRFFSADSYTCAYLPLNTQPARNKLTCIYYMTGEHGNICGYGFWTPDRAAAPVSGQITINHLAMNGFGTSFTIAEATNVQYYNILGNGSCYSAFASMEFPSYCTVGVTAVDFGGTGDSFYTGSNQYLNLYKVSAYPARTFMRLHGVNGVIDGVMSNDTGYKTEYYFKSYAGAGGGPLTFKSISLDNEWAPVPVKGLFYHEASVAPVSGLTQTPCANALTLRTIYTGLMPDTCAWIDLADNPAVPLNKAGTLTASGLGTWGYTDRIDAAVRTNSPSTHWTGNIYGCTTAGTVNQWIKYTGVSGQCGIVTDHTDMTGAPAGGPAPSNYFGMRFTVGASDLTVTELGRWCYSGNSATHRLLILRDSDLSIVADTNLSMSGGTPGQFKYATLTPAVTLSANGVYYLMSYEPNTSLDTWGDMYQADFSYPVNTTTTAATLYGAARSRNATERPGNWATGSLFGPVNFKVNGTPFITTVPLGRPLQNGTWLQGCHLIDIHHPIPDGQGNAYVEYQCTQSGAPGTWVGNGKVN